jgi:branched-chain amino acid transport system substrate-binding protein
VLEGVELELANIVREMRRQGLRAHVLGGLGLAGPRVIETAGAANIEGSFSVTGYLWDGTDPKTQSFVTKFRERSRKIPHFTTAQMYDTVYLVKAALEAAGVANRPDALALDREKARRALEAVRDFPGITGRTSINADGDVDKQVFVIVAHEGRWVPAP